MDTSSERSGGRWDLIAMWVLVAFALAIWLPALWTPFWGDDYVYLQAARLANQSGQPWVETFWPLQPLQFWRPLSQEAWWRVVEHAWGADVRVAHAVLLALHGAAALSVGLLALAVARVAGWPARWHVAGLSAALYAVLALNLLPVHWVAAANSPLLVLFTSLLLAAWLLASQVQGAWRLVLLAALPLLFVLALLSKESAILMPVLMVVLSLFAGMRFRVADHLALAVCTVIGIAWLVLRQQVALPPAPQYAYAFGGNLVKNLMSLMAWLFNVPREALRMVATDELPKGAVWAMLTALPVAAAWLLALKTGRGRLSARQWLLLLSFPLIAYAPYFPLIWNSYGYYAAIAGILPVIALARLLQGRSRVVLAAVLMGISAWIAVAGTRWLDHPGLIGRARWAETSLQELSAQQLKAPLWVKIADEQRFYAVGMQGLSWRLGIPLEQMHQVEVCPAAGEQAGTCLEVDAAGQWAHRSLSP